LQERAVAGRPRPCFATQDRAFPAISDCWLEGGPPRQLPYFDDDERKKRDEIYRIAYSIDEAPRSIQEEALLAYIRKKHVLGIAPTNAGKSRIFLLIALWILLHEDHLGIEILIYPLLGLERKQVELLQLQCPELNATWYDASGDKMAQRRSIAAGNHRVVGVSPEVATSRWFTDLLGGPFYKSHVRAMIIDEVHCVVTWAFRIAFTHLMEHARSPNPRWRGHAFPDSHAWRIPRLAAALGD
jgi:hypothetical protein